MWHFALFNAQSIMAIENCQKMGLTHNGLEIRDSVIKNALAGGFASALGRIGGICS